MEELYVTWKSISTNFVKEKKFLFSLLSSFLGISRIVKFLTFRVDKRMQYFFVRLIILSDREFFGDNLAVVPVVLPEFCGCFGCGRETWDSFFTVKRCIYMLFALFPTVAAAVKWTLLWQTPRHWEMLSDAFWETFSWEIFLLRSWQNAVWNKVWNTSNNFVSMRL